MAKRKTITWNTFYKRAIKAVPILEKCEECGATEKLVRYHPDYRAPLDIVVLCRACERKRPRKTNAERASACPKTRQTTVQYSGKMLRELFALAKYLGVKVGPLTRMLVAEALAARARLDSHEE